MGYGPSLQCSLPPFNSFSPSPKPLSRDSSVLGGAKYVFATRSRTVIELVPPQRPVTRVPAALCVFRPGPSAFGFIEGSRDLRNRVWINGKKHVLRIGWVYYQKMYNNKIFLHTCNILRIEWRYFRYFLYILRISWFCRQISGVLLRSN